VKPPEAIVMPDFEQLPLINGIPTPDAVRDRLAQLARERLLLRSLLRLSHQRDDAAQRERAQRQDRKDAAHE
jgi:hypothetical protein